MYSKITLLGRLGGKPELRYSPNGTAVCNFSMVTNRKYTSDGERKEEVTWYRVVVFGKSGEAANEYLDKGSLCLVEGALVPGDNGSPKIWKDKDGNPHASFEVRADLVKFLDTKRHAEQTEDSQL